MPIFKVKYSYKHDSPVGGNFPHTNWKEQLVVYDAATGEELQKKIDEFCKNDFCGYRKHIKVLSIEQFT